MKNQDILKKQFELAKNKRKQAEDQIDECYLYTYPELSFDLTRDEEPEQFLIYDSTARESAQTLLSSIMSYLYPQNSAWAVLDVSEEIKSQGAPSDMLLKLNRWNRTLFDQINTSNFYVAAGEAMQDCLVGGTGCIFPHLADGKKLTFAAIPAKELYILENGMGNVDTVFRCHCMPARTVLQKWKSAPQWVKDKATENPDTLIDIVESCTPCDKPGKWDYLIHTLKDWEELDGFDMDYMPFIVFRWRKQLGHVWGWSQVREMLPDIRVVNKLMEIILVDGEFAASGAWQSSDPQVAERKLEPGTIVVTTDEIKPIQFPGNLRVTMEQVQQYRESIRRGLFANGDLPDNGPAMTAREVGARQAQFFRRIGPAALKLETEFLRPVVFATLQLLVKNDVMPTEINNGPYKLEVTSLVRKGLKSQEINNAMQLLQMLLGLGEVALKQIKVEEFVRFVLKEGGFPPDFINEGASGQEFDQAQILQQLTAVMGNGARGTAAAAGAAPASPAEAARQIGPQ